MRGERLLGPVPSARVTLQDQRFCCCGVSQISCLPGVCPCALPSSPQRAVCPASKYSRRSDAEVLSMFAMIINRLRGKMEAEVRSAGLPPNLMFCCASFALAVDTSFRLV